MEPIQLDQIPDNIFIQDIEELTEEFRAEFPHFFNEIKNYLNINIECIYITDFIEDERKINHFYGYFYNVCDRKFYYYEFKGNNSKFKEVEVSSLTMKDSFSIRVLHLLKRRSDVI